MSERTNKFFNVPLLNAIVVAWIDRRQIGEYIGDRHWYKEGSYQTDINRTQRTSQVVALELGYKVIYTGKGYGPYHNITNKPAQIKRFIDNVSRKIDGARMVNFYDAGRKPPNYLFQIVL